jgi:hypothetical protein
MNKGVSHIHEMSQNRLKGRPKTMGCTRSQSDTEKHTAVNGIKAMTIAPQDGFFILHLLLRERKDGEEMRA